MKPSLEENQAAAEPILREAQERREKRLGTQAGLTQHTYQNLTACLTKPGKYEEAEDLYKHTDDGHVKLFTEDHHWVQHIEGQHSFASQRLKVALRKLWRTFGI